MNALTGEALAVARSEAQEAVRKVRAACSQLDDAAIDLILRDARSHYAWTDKPVPRALLETIYDITANGPTGSPAIFAAFSIRAGLTPSASIVMPSLVDVPNTLEV